MLRRLLFALDLTVAQRLSWLMPKLKRTIFASLICALLPVGATTAHAALVDRGGGLIYDTTLDITWLQNANVGGSMTWAEASSWAANFS